jgi:hypothetical protein
VIQAISIDNSQEATCIVRDDWAGFLDIYTLFIIYRVMNLNIYKLFIAGVKISNQQPVSSYPRR